MTALDLLLVESFTGGVNLPAASQDGYLTVGRVEAGRTYWDYVASDDISFGDQGVPVGRYMAAAPSDLRAGIIAALAANPSKKRFIIPPGEWLITSTIGSAQGLRDNLIFDGIDALRCRIYRTSAGQIFLWPDESANIVIQNITFDIDSATETPFSASVNVAISTNVLVRNCRFLANFEDATSNGANHGLFLLGGENIHVRDCYFKRVQTVLCGLGRSLNIGSFIRNVVEDPNDLGVSVISDTAHELKNITIAHNQMHGNLKGAGYIYVGSDGFSTNHALMSDILIADNNCACAIDDQFTGTAIGIIVPWATVNKRIKIVRNTVVNTNAATVRENARAIMAFLRVSTMTSAFDVTVAENSCDFLSADPLYGLIVSGNGIEGVRVDGNVIAEGSRGIEVSGASNADICNNIVQNSISNTLLLSSADQVMKDIRVRNNYLRTTVALQAAILSSGDNNQIVQVEHNRLLSPFASWNAVMTGGATLDGYYNHNFHNNGVNGFTPTQDEDNVTLAF